MPMTLTRRGPRALLGWSVLAAAVLLVVAASLIWAGAPLQLTVTMIVIGFALGVAAAVTLLWVITRDGARRDRQAGRRMAVRLPLRWAAFTGGAVVVATLSYGVFGLFEVFVTDAASPDSRPLSCDWPAHFGGDRPQPGQEGAVRCYLKAVADDRIDEMKAVAADRPDNVPTAASMPHTHDAREGIATVTLTQDTDDSADFQAYVRYADGRVDVREFEISIPDAPESWRDWDVNSHSTEQYLR